MNTGYRPNPKKADWKTNPIHEKPQRSHDKEHRPLRIDVQCLDRRLGTDRREQSPDRLALRRPQQRVEDVVVGLDSVCVGWSLRRGNVPLLHKDVLRLNLQV
jgi:hypothetical protein